MKCLQRDHSRTPTVLSLDRSIFLNTSFIDHNMVPSKKNFLYGMSKIRWKLNVSLKIVLCSLINHNNHNLFPQLIPEEMHEC